MGWISLLVIFAGLAFAEEPTKLLTKHTPETLRYISMDGRTVYVQKKPGVLGLISSFRSVDFLTETSASDVLITGSHNKLRLAIEIIPNAHLEYNLIKANKIFVVNWGQAQPKEIGQGKGARLHLKDDWISWYDGYAKVLYIMDLPNQKKYEIKLSSKSNPYFTPEVVMAGHDNVTYTDVNENGYATLVSYNLSTKVSSIIYRSPQTGTKLELCRNESYMAIGEFPYEGVNRGSKIMHIKLQGQINLAGYSTIYNSIEPDIGNMVCAKEAVFFIKTMGQNKVLTTKTTDAVKLDIRSQKVEVKTGLGNVSQLLEMDSRVMIPFRGDFYVIEGTSNLGTDTLKSTPSKQEELPLDI